MSIANIEDILSEEEVQCPYCGEKHRSRKWVHECLACGYMWRPVKHEWRDSESHITGGNERTTE